MGVVEREQAAWDGLALAIANDRLLLGPEGAALVVRALDAVARVDRTPFSPAVAHVRRVASTVAQHARIGHADVRRSTDPPPSGTWITTAEAAGQLGLSQRHCSRLATAEAFGTPRKVRGKWMVLQDEVTAYAAAERRTA